MDRQYIWTSWCRATRRCSGSAAPVRRMADQGVAGKRSGPIPISVSRPRWSLMGSRDHSEKDRPGTRVPGPGSVHGPGSFRTNLTKFDAPDDVTYSKTTPAVPYSAGTRAIVAECLMRGEGGVVDLLGSRTTRVGSRVLTQVEVVCASGH